MIKNEQRSNWEQELESLEKNKTWDSAIELMEKVIEEEPYDVDAAISMNYLLMNLFVEEDHNEMKHDYYADLVHKYFLSSYRKFYNNLCQVKKVVIEGYT